MHDPRIVGGALRRKVAGSVDAPRLSGPPFLGAGSRIDLLRSLVSIHSRRYMGC